MTFGEFKKESSKTNFGRCLFKMWGDNKIPLAGAMYLFNKYKKLI